MSADILHISDYRQPAVVPAGLRPAATGQTAAHAADADRPAAAEHDLGKRTAASRLLALLDAFGVGDGAKTLSELSRHAGLSLTTTHRLVHELRGWGGVEVDPRGRYRLSNKLLALASGSAQAFELRERALPHLMALNRVAGISVQLAVRDGGDVLYLEALRTIPNYTGQNRIGGRMPLHTVATGLVLLAHEEPAFVDEYLSGPLARFTERTPTDPAAIRRELERLRERRYVCADRTVTPEAGSVAAPVVGEDGRVVAAVGVIYFVAQTDPRQLIRPLLTAAKQISQAMTETRSAPDPRTIAFNRRRAGLL
ncbi:IclR family transcriptional regulator [Microbacterium sp. GXF7504]